MTIKNKRPMLFFMFYALLMASLIFFAIDYHSNPTDPTKIEQKSRSEETGIFMKELQAHEEKVKQKEKERVHKWKPSNAFIITAISISSVLDIIIILLWARHENKKRQGTSSDRKRWTDYKWFWNVVALGIVQPKDNRIVINWKNLILFLLVMYLLKTYLFKLLAVLKNNVDFGLAS